MCAKPKRTWDRSIFIAPINSESFSICLPIRSPYSFLSMVRMFAILKRTWDGSTFIAAINSESFSVCLSVRKNFCNLKSIRPSARPILFYRWCGCMLYPKGFELDPLFLRQASQNHFLPVYPFVKFFFIDGAFAKSKRTWELFLRQAIQNHFLSFCPCETIFGIFNLSVHPLVKFFFIDGAHDCKIQKDFR